MIVTHSRFPWITVRGLSLRSTAVITLEVVQRPIAKPVSSKFHISSSWIPCSWIASYTVSNHCFITLGSSCFARWYEIRRLYCVCTSEWRLIKVDAQLTPRVALESCSRSWSKISAIPCRNSGLIGNPLLSASRSCLTRELSSISVNLWLLARVSDRDLIPASRLRRVDSGTSNTLAASKIDLVFFSFHALTAIWTRDSLKSGILFRNGGNITRWNRLIGMFGGCGRNPPLGRIRRSVMDYVNYLVK